jgi:hypothetical protein
LAIGAVVVALLQQPARSQSGAVIYVTTTAPAINGTDGFCSLPEAIYAANFDNNVAVSPSDPTQLVTTECEKGTGDDVIELTADVFPMSAVLNDIYIRLAQRQLLSFSLRSRSKAMARDSSAPSIRGTSRG